MTLSKTVLFKVIKSTILNNALYNTPYDLKIIKLQKKAKELEEKISEIGHKFRCANTQNEFFTGTVFLTFNRADMSYKFIDEFSFTRMEYIFYKI